jgi:ankyrin repeat protein
MQQESSPTSDSPSDQHMDRQLLKACSKGDLNLLKHLLLWVPNTLLATTPHGNNCLHMAAMLGHKEFAKAVWSREPSLFSGTNIDGETPLIAALMAANVSLASEMITAASQLMQPNGLEEGKLFNEMLLKADKRGENVLHHAMRNGFEDLALDVLNIEPRLSEQVNKSDESPMNMAARRGYSRIVAILLDIPSSAHFGPRNTTALSAAVRAGDTGYASYFLRTPIIYFFRHCPTGISLIK